MNVHLITKPDCVHCTRAKKMLDAEKLGYTVEIVGVQVNRADIQEKYPQARQFPIVIIDGKYIGGADNLESILKVRKEGEVANSAPLFDAADLGIDLTVEESKGDDDGSD